MCITSTISGCHSRRPCGWTLRIFQTDALEIHTRFTRLCQGEMQKGSQKGKGERRVRFFGASKRRRECPKAWSNYSIPPTSNHISMRKIFVKSRGVMENNQASCARNGLTKAPCFASKRASSLRSKTSRKLSCTLFWRIMFKGEPCYSNANKSVTLVNPFLYNLTCTPFSIIECLHVYLPRCYYKEYAFHLLYDVVLHFFTAIYMLLVVRACTP